MTLPHVITHEVVETAKNRTHILRDTRKIISFFLSRHTNGILDAFMQFGAGGLQAQYIDLNKRVNDMGHQLTEVVHQITGMGQQISGMGEQITDLYSRVAGIEGMLVEMHTQMMAK